MTQQRDTFGIQFYPTPIEVGLKMIEGLELRNVRVYDPGAGRGDLLDIAKANTVEIERPWRGGGFIKTEIETFAGEIDWLFHGVLRGKGHVVVASDIFDAPPATRFDIWLMNPPFREGVKHLLRAFEIAQGARIRCLLNAESLRKLPDGSYRNADQERLYHILQTNGGTVTELGEAFTAGSGADRPAKVTVVLIDLQEVKETYGYRLNFNPDEADTEVLKISEFESSELAPTDAFAGFEAMYHAAIGAFKEYMEAKARLRHYMSYLQTNSYRSTSDPVEAAESISPISRKDRSAAEQRLDVFAETLLARAWDALFARTKLGNLMTEKVRKQLEEEIAEFHTLAFTSQNMQAMFAELDANSDKIKIEAVLEAFDLIRSYNWHNEGSDPGTRGYKTNSSYKVQSRFILDYMGAENGTRGVSHYRSDKLDDIERALCLMQGIDFETLGDKKISEVFRYERFGGQIVTTTFFEVRFYKKGTMHFKWLDEESCRRVAFRG